MLCALLPGQVFADTGEPSGGLFTEASEPSAQLPANADAPPTCSCGHICGSDCGYSPGSAAVECGHIHDAAICGYIEGTPCTHVHEHNDSCGYSPATPEIPCDLGCTELDGSGNIIHSPDCAFTPAADGAPCAYVHIHDESCGYSEGGPCSHLCGDGSCSYAAAVDASPCGHICRTIESVYTLSHEVHPVTVTSLSPLPAGAYLAVEALSAEDAAAIVGEAQILFAYDIKIIVPAEGGDIEYQPLPENPVTVTVAPPVAPTAPVEVVHVSADAGGAAETESVPGVSVTEDGAVEFAAEGFSVYIGTIRSELSYPSEIYYNGTNFYSAEACADSSTMLVDSSGTPFTSLPSLLAALSGNTTVYMKARYNVTGAESMGSSLYAVTLKRHHSYTGVLISVAGSKCSLTLADITVDGGAVWSAPASPATRTNSGISATACLILVKESGVLNLNSGSALQNNYNNASTADALGGAVMLNSGNLTISGGKIQYNYTAQNAGAIKADYASTVTMYSGEISANAAYKHGGAIQLWGGGGVTGIKAELYMYGGSIAGNSGGSSSVGGGIAVYNNSNFIMSGGSITGNSAGRGGGVCFTDDYTTVTVSGSARITGNKSGSADNNLQIGSGKTVSVPAALSGDALIDISGTTPTLGVNVAQFAPSVPADPSHFNLSGYSLEASGSYLSIGPAITVKYVTNAGTGTGNAPSSPCTLPAALTALTGGGTIVVCDEITVSAQQTISQSITLTSVYGGVDYRSTSGAMLKRSASYTTYLLNVASTASLNLSNVTIDGNRDSGVASTRSLIVSYGALNIKDGALLQNNKASSDGGGITMSNGTLSMTGGEISGNSTDTNGGGVYLYTGSMNMSGGRILGNTAVNNGGGVLAHYDFTEGQTDRAFFTMTGGEISGNSTVNKGNGIYVDNTISLNGSVDIRDDVGFSTGAYISVVSAAFVPSAPISIAMYETDMAGGRKVVRYEHHTTDIPSDAHLQFYVPGKQLVPGAEADTLNCLVLSPSDVQYVNGSSGSDSYDGQSVANAVKTLAQAYANLPADGGAIVVCGNTPVGTQLRISKNITISGKYGWVDYRQTNGAMLTRSNDLNGDGVAGDPYVGSLLFVSTSGALTLADISIDGGAVWSGSNPATRTNSGIASAVAGLVRSSGTLNLNGGAVLQNNCLTRGNDGGLIVEGGTAYINGGRLVNNKAANYGGGMFINSTSANVIMSAGEISGNYNIGTGGGGIGIFGGSLSVSGGKISGNASDNMGGGVYLYNDDCSLSMSGGEISGNTTSQSGNGIYYMGGTLTLSGTPRITDAVYLATSTRLITVDAPTFFAPAGSILVTAGTKTAGTNIVQYSGDMPSGALSQFHMDGRVLTPGTAASGEANYLEIAQPIARISYDTVSAGSTLTASLYGGTARSYKWQSSLNGTDWTDIPGAADAAYVIQASDAGKLIRVSITDSGYPVLSYFSGAIQYKPNTATYFITIPDSVAAASTSGSFNISGNLSGFPSGQGLNVTVSSQNGFKLVCGTAELGYTLSSSSGGEALANNAAVASFSSNGISAVPIYYAITGSPVCSGNYSGALTFTVSMIFLS